MFVSCLPSEDNTPSTCAKLSHGQNAFIISQGSARVGLSPITTTWQTVKTHVCQKGLQRHDTEPRGLHAVFPSLRKQCCAETVKLQFLKKSFLKIFLEVFILFFLSDSYNKKKWLRFFPPNLPCACQ